VKLGKRSEPQPDASLLIISEKGGATRNEQGYVVGAPELIVEIASSSESYDLHSKKADYERAGVREYVVVELRQRKVSWFVSRGGRLEPLSSDAGGIFHSEVFPGLWLDSVALLSRETAEVLAVVKQGIATPEHAAFVEKLNRA
jgi:Uma2 family endonuclease